MTRLLRVAVLCALAACGDTDPAPRARELDVSRKEQALALHRATLARELSHDPAHLKPLRLGKGVRAVRVERGFRHVTMLELEGDGGVRRGCVDELPAEASP